LNTLESRRNPIRTIGARARNLVRRARRLPDPIRYRHTDEPLGHWQRIVMNDAIGAQITSLGPERLRAAEISGDTHAARNWKDYTSLSYPAFDICAPIENPASFDVVICEQVLEHVPDPCLAARNLRELCVPGGHVIVSTPFLIRVHEMALIHDMRDYWRFTPRGLQTLLERADLVVDKVDSWGNRDCVVGNFDAWPGFRWWQSLRNEPDLPVQVWAFAHRPS
jgi:SAM-dependent methyltransferase